EPPLIAPGISTVAPEAPVTAHGAPDAGATWERATEAASYSRLSPAVFASDGHFAGRWIAEIGGNELAASAFPPTPKSAAPVGAVILERLADQRSGSPGPTFAMEKRERGYFPEGGDWKYVVASPAGVLEDAGQLQLCARCHAEAGPDFLFPA